MRTRWVVLTGVAVALLLAGVVSIFASSAPDGLTHAIASFNGDIQPLVARRLG